ncbi:MAG: MFS transporter [Saprospiraceae bacterium]|nr:MFS transporter [Saprospiraceae bacterium]
MAACLGMLLFGIVLISLGSIMPSILSEYSLGNAQAGILASLLPTGILLGSVIFGPIVDRFSYRIFLVMCSLLIIAGLEGIAISTNLLSLQASIFLIGFGGGMINGGTNALVADISESRADERSANLSFLGVFFGIGALGVPSVLASLSSFWNYNQILQMTGYLLFLPLIYFLTITYPTPKIRAASLTNTIAMASDKRLWVLGFFLFFQSALEGVANNWTTTFLQSENKMESSHALVALSIFVLSLTITRLLLAWLLRRMDPIRVLLISIGVLIAASLLMASTNTPILLIAALALLGIGSAAGFPVVLGYAGELYSELRGTAFSFIFVIALWGNILINYLTGLAAHRYGIEIYPWILLMCGASLTLIGTTKLHHLVRKIH